MTITTAQELIEDDANEYNINETLAAMFLDSTAPWVELEVSGDALTIARKAA
jgi:hypothetical protein